MLKTGRRKQESDTQYFAVMQSMASERWSLMQGQTLAIRRGASGRRFALLIDQGHIRPLDALPPNVTPVPLEPAALDGEARRAVTPSERLTRAQLLERFAWTDTELQNAETLGFPRPTGSVVVRQGLQPTWHERHVDEWTARLVALARTLECRR